jgi:hypothetical protein
MQKPEYGKTPRSGGCEDYQGLRRIRGLYDLERLRNMEKPGMNSTELRTVNRYMVNEPGLYVGELSVSNPVDLAIFRIEFLERTGRLPDIKKMKGDDNA